MWLVGLVFWLLLAFFLLFHAVTYTVRWYDRCQREGSGATLKDLTWTDISDALAEMGCHALFLLLLAADPVLSLARRAYRRQGAGAGKNPESAGPAARPVIFVHGMGMRGLTMYPIARRFRREGRETRLFTYWPPDRPLDDYARQLDDFIEALCREEGFSEFDAVAHSLGGLVLRAYLTAHGGARRIRRIVTLGTPHGGSELWRFSPFFGASQLRPGCETLRRLDEGGLPDGVEVTAVASDFDELVIPQACARWEVPGVHNLTVSGIGHTRMVFSGEIYRLAREALF